MGIKGRGQRKNKILEYLKREGEGEEERKIGWGRVKNGINGFAGASRLATLKRGWIWGM